MEIKPFFSVLIILTVLAILGVIYWPLVQARLEQAFLEQALPDQALPDQALPDQALPDQALGTGTLKLYLSDAPMDAENVTGVYITINEIQYHRDGQWTTCEEFEGPKAYNLLELTGGNYILLGEFTLPAGNYTQIRFMLDIPQKGSHPTSPGCYIEFADNSTEPLFVPSGGETGYKAIGYFEVPVNGSVDVTADFDVHKAVVVAGSSYILKPTIKLIVNY
ncbi:MAG: DUF4382 domain-containing protein [Dehalococcoidia bacterium]|nr:DUF4382 domain-containing protein [Dehalococcoidia bacterium]